MDGGSSVVAGLYGSLGTLVGVNKHWKSKVVTPFSLLSHYTIGTIQEQPRERISIPHWAVTTTTSSLEDP